MSEPILSCKEIYKSFSLRGKTIEVLKGVQLDVVRGETVVISGRSGEGKTTLMWLLSGIDTPDSGEIVFDGQPFSTLDALQTAELRRKKIGLIFQNFNLIPSWTALENVESALISSELTAEEKHEKAANLLEEMELSSRIDNLPSELSVGQQQRVALARALVNDPILIIADEPTGNVDAQTAEFMLNILNTRIRQNGASMIVATHGNYHAADVADKQYRLESGVLIC